MTGPKWMKVKSLEERVPFDSWTSGHLNPEYYRTSGDYFVKWIQAFEQEGIKIHAVTPQNEPLNHGNSASLFMGWEEARDFIKTGLGPVSYTHLPRHSVNSNSCRHRHGQYHPN